MRRFVQWFNKIPIKVFVLIWLTLYIVISILVGQLHIQTNSIEAIIIVFVGLLSFIPLCIRILNHLKAKGSGAYYFFRFIFGYMLICAPVIILLFLDNKLGLNGFLCVSGIALEVVLLVCLFIRHRMKQWKKESSHSFEKLCADFEDGREIEFTYDNIRYLFIPENGRYYFKRIVAIDPYEYEILAESEDALACIESAGINGKKITGLWPDVEDITVY